MSLGKSHGCVLLVGGNVDCWLFSGSEDHGEAADRTLGDAASVDAGYYRTCAVLTSGNVECWGDNPWPYEAALPYAGGDAVQVATKDPAVTCILREDGSIYCQGRSETGSKPRYTGADVASITSAHDLNCVILTNGNAQCWGVVGHETTCGRLRCVYEGEDAVAVSGLGMCVLARSGSVSCLTDGKAGGTYPPGFRPSYYALTPPI